MKKLLRKIFSPMLCYFEAGEGEYSYKKSHRTILIVAGLLFTILSATTLVVGIMYSLAGAALPGIIFVAVAITCLVVGVLGSDRAVSKIWGNR